MNLLRTAVTGAVSLAAFGAAASSAPAAIVKVSAPGRPVETGASHGMLSADGRFAAFDASSSAIVAGDTNGETDTFIRELGTGAIERTSVTAGGTQAVGRSIQLDISGDGRFVLFSSDAANLVPGDTNAAFDVFVKDRQTGAVERANVTTAGVQANGPAFEGSISEDGRLVAFSSDATNLVPGDTNGRGDVFVRDLPGRVTQRVIGNQPAVQPDGASFTPSLSADGRYVSFTSQATNLVTGDTNATGDVFVRDRQLGRVQRVSVSSSGGQSNSFSGQADISADGRVVQFTSNANNLVAGEGDTRADVYAFDRATSTVERISTAADGASSTDTSAFGTVSPDGRFVAFMSFAGNLGTGTSTGDLLVRDRRTGALRVAAADVTSDDGSELQPSIARDGRTVVFSTEQENVIPGDPFGFDVFAVSPLTADLQLSASRIDFGGQAASTIGGVQTLTVRGQSAVLPTPVGTVRLTGPGAEQYLLARDDCSGRVLGAGEACAIGLRFAPVRTGAAADTSVRLGDALDVALAGVGTALPAAGTPGPVGATGPAGPAGPKGEPGRIVCRASAIRMCETLFAPGSFGTTAVLRLSRDGATVARTARRLSAETPTRVVLKRPRGLRAGRYRLAVLTVSDGEREVVARRSVRLKRAR